MSGFFKTKRAAMAKLVYAPGLGLGGSSMGVRVPLAVNKTLSKKIRLILQLKKHSRIK